MAREKRGEKLGYWRLSGFAEGYKKPRENKVTAEINRTQLLLKKPTGLCSYSAPVKTTRTLQAPLWSFNGYDALFLIIFGIMFKS